jgi:hypothetical protein
VKIEMIAQGSRDTQSDIFTITAPRRELQALADDLGCLSEITLSEDMGGMFYAALTEALS